MSIQNLHPFSEILDFFKWYLSGGYASYLMTNVLNAETKDEEYQEIH